MADPVVVPSPGAADVAWAQDLTTKFNTLQDQLEFAVPVFAYKTVAESVNNSAVVQDDDHLFVSVAANARYRIIMHLVVTSTSTTPDLIFRFNGPAGATFTGSAAGLSTAATAVTGELNAGALANITSFPTSNFGYASLSGTHGIIFVGSLLVGSTAGTLQLMWAQNTATAVNVTVAIGSSLELRRIS